MNLNKDRYIYIDYIRIFAILMVIILHCVCDYYNNFSNVRKDLWFILGFVNEICRTGVPLFFMISGFLLLNKEIKDIKTFYKQRFAKIGIPFLFYNAFYYMTVPNADKSISGFLKEFINCGSGYHLWFIYSILFIYLMIPFIKMITDKCNLKMLIFFLLLVIFQTTIKPFMNVVFFDKAYIYLTEDGIVGYMGYLILGYILGKYDFEKKQKYLIYLTGILFMIVTPLVSMSNVVKNNEFLFHGGYALNHYVEAAAVFLFFKDYIHKKSYLVFMLSNASLGAYFIHVFILEQLKKVPMDLTPSNQMMLWIASTVVLSFLWGVFEKKIIGLKSLFNKQIPLN